MGLVCYYIASFDLLINSYIFLIFSTGGQPRIWEGGCELNRWALILASPGQLSKRWSVLGIPPQRLQIGLFMPFNRCSCVCLVCPIRSRIKVLHCRLPIAAGRGIFVHVGLNLRYLWVKVDHSSIFWFSKLRSISLCMSLLFIGVKMNVDEWPMLWASWSASSLPFMP